MARKFNGTSDKASRAIDLSPYSLISFSFWLWWDAFANNDKLVFEYTPTTNGSSGFIIDPNSNSASTGAGRWGFAMSTTTGSLGFWGDGFTRPSAAAWHHYVLVMDRATPVNFAWLDGVAQTLTPGQHTVRTYGTPINSTLFFMCRNNASLFGAGRLAEVGIWGGVALTTRDAVALASGSAPPYLVRPGGLIFYAPLYGADSPEPDYGGTQKNVTVSGASFVQHPPVMPGMFRQRSFQPMPV